MVGWHIARRQSQLRARSLLVGAGTAGCLLSSRRQHPHACLVRGRRLGKGEIGVARRRSCLRAHSGFGGEGRIDVVVRGPDDILRHKHFEAEEWSDWKEINSVLAFIRTSATPITKKILQETRNHSLLLSSNPSEYLFPEVGALTRPFFYTDAQHTFFVEPRVTDTTIERWEEWVFSTPVSGQGWKTWR